MRGLTYAAFALRAVSAVKRSDAVAETDRRLGALADESIRACCLQVACSVQLLMWHLAGSVNDSVYRSSRPRAGMVRVIWY
jgi:hypothetical protein